MRRVVRYRPWLIVAGLIAGVTAVALWPTPLPVDVASTTRGSLVVTVDEEGETRVRNRYVVSAPVTGRVLRIELEPGDRVVRGKTVVARLRAEAPALLDARSRAEAEAGVEAAKAALGRAEAELRRVTATRDLAGVELRRQRELATAQLTTAQAVDTAESNLRTAGEAVTSAEFAVASGRSQLAQAEARLMNPTLEASGRVLTLTAPADGVVLRRLRESESVVGAGDALLEIGNPSRDIEIVSDLLSTDAVRVRVGAAVYIERWGGVGTLTARVRRVEPSGFTKVSALGVEEQRVNVLMEPDGPHDGWQALGDGFRVDVRVVLWEGTNVIKVPTNALVRQGTGWSVFVVDGDHARLVPVDVGQRNPDEAEVRSGLDAGRTVIVHPGDRVADGVRVEVRQATGAS